MVVVCQNIIQRLNINRVAQRTEPSVYLTLTFAYRPLSIKRCPHKQQSTARLIRRVKGPKNPALLQQ